MLVLFAQGFSVQGVYFLGGKCPGGKCPGGTCPGGYVLEPRDRMHQERVGVQVFKPLIHFHCVLQANSRGRGPDSSARLTPCQPWPVNHILLVISSFSGLMPAQIPPVPGAVQMGLALSQGLVSMSEY